MQVNKKCTYHSNKNCFIYLNSNSNFKIDENTVVQLSFGQSIGYFSVLFFNNTPSKRILIDDSEKIFLNGLYAKKLKINDGDQVTIKNVHRDSAAAYSITVKPISSDDWEILELNLESIENDLLNQIKVVFKNQIFPVWIESDVCVFVQTVDYEPTGGNFTCINSMTRVIIEPFENRKQSDETVNQSTTAKEWFDCFHVEFEDNNAISKCSNEFSRCSTLTKAEFCDKPSTNGVNYEHLISIQALESPMQSLKSKDSSITSMKKFLNSMYSSYPEIYFHGLYDVNYRVNALLNTAQRSIENEDWTFQKPKLKISNFLRRQLKLFELNPKVLVKATLVTNEIRDKYLSTTAIKKIKLKSNHKNIDTVKKSFLKFIDDNCECLCPIILTDQMFIELEDISNVDRATIDCVLCLLDTNPIGINSSMLLNDLVRIEVEYVDEIIKKPTLEHLTHRKFDIEFFDCKWFQSNIKEIDSFLEVNLFANFDTGSYLRRNMMLYGLKGSGKSIICKYLCNKLSDQKCAYFYVDCQNFLSKTAETIYEQLKLIYSECIWYENLPCLVVLENIDLLIENKSHTVDPNSMLYHAQIVESIKEIFSYVWANKTSRVVTIVTSSSPFIELPSIFHCLDEHGFFSHFVTVKPHTDKEESTEIIELLLQKFNAKLEPRLLESILSQMDGFVYQDIEKLIEKLVFNNWSLGLGEERETNTDTEENLIKFQHSERVLVDYTCINMLETNFYKAKHQMDWSLVGGMSRVKEKLVETLVWPVRYKQLFKKLSMKQSAGVVLYGPSGCGKTLIASALANESKFNFLSVKGPELLSKYIGASEQNVRELFNKAEKAKPCIIFFDEFDSLAPKRGHDSTGVTDRVVNQLLTQLDGIEQLNGVYLLAATSRPDLIDQALLRPGRMDTFLYVDYPDQAELKEIFQIYLGKMNFSTEEVDLNELAGMCVNFSGADVKSVICDALVKAFHRANKHLKQTDDVLKLSQTASAAESLSGLIKIEKEDLISSIESIKQTINQNERVRMKKTYQNWKNKKNATDAASKKELLKPKVTLA